MTESLDNTPSIMFGPVFEGNVPGPPELRFEGVPTASNESVPRRVSEDFLTEPMWSDRHPSSPTTFARSQYTTASPSPIQEGADLHEPETATLEALRRMVDELEQCFDALSLTHERLGNASESRSSTPPAADQSKTNHEAAFLAVARRLVACLQIPIARRLLTQAIESRNSLAATVNRAESLVSKSESLLDRYYDAAGDVKIFGERLVDFDYAYTEQATLRLHLQDQGHEMDITDEDFGRDYLEQRAKLEHELNRAIEKADNLKASCQLVGLDPDSQAKVADESDVEGSVVLVNVGDEVMRKVDANPLFDLYGFPSTTALHASTGRLDSGSTPVDGSPFERDRSLPEVERWIRALDDDFEVEPSTIPLPASEPEGLAGYDRLSQRPRALSAAQQASSDKGLAPSPPYSGRMFHSDPSIGYATEASPGYDYTITQCSAPERTSTAQPKRRSYPLLPESRILRYGTSAGTDFLAPWKTDFGR